MLHHHVISATAVLALAAAPLTAQSTTFVNPPPFATKEGPTRISFPFGTGTTEMHYQQICALSAFASSTWLIKQIAWRRDNDTILSSGNYVAWTPDLTVTLSTSPLPAAQMSNVFKNNIGNDATVFFRGILNWPAQNKIPPGPTPFAYTVPSRAGTIFLYTNTKGDISIDVVRRKTFGNPNSLFFMDATSGPISPNPRLVTRIGTGCSNPTGKNAVLFYNNWIPGAHSRVLLYNAANSSPALWAIGLAPLAVPFDMGVVGAPGCRIYSLPLITVPGTTTGSATAYRGRWDIRLDIPATTPAGFPFYSQFALLNDTHIGNAANFSVSDGHRVVLGAFVNGFPAHSEAHSSSLTATTAALVQQGYAMVTQFTY